MSRKVVHFVRLSQSGEYRVADLRQLVDKSYQKEKDKGAYQIAEISQEQYKELEKGKVLKNKDLGFVDMVSAKNAIANVEAITSENQSLQEEIARLQKQNADLLKAKNTKTTKAKSTKTEADSAEVVEAPETE